MFQPIWSSLNKTVIGVDRISITIAEALDNLILWTEIQNSKKGGK